MTPRASDSTPSAFAGLPEEIRLRLLKRAIDRAGHEGPAELGKVEALLAVLDRAIANGERQARLKQTLAGAVISLIGAEFMSIRRRRGGATGVRGVHIPQYRQISAPGALTTPEKPGFCAIF